VIPSVFDLDNPGLINWDGNKEGGVCPRALVFLTTEEGGELDRRK